MVQHVNERCHGCGLWKKKNVECSHCAVRPNRLQVAVQKPLHRVSSLENAMHASDGGSQYHINERCHGCGLWKKKKVECSHCAVRPNRLQVAVARPKGEGALQSYSGATNGHRDWKEDHLPAHVLHPNERCKGCGLWKKKALECFHCASRPNRMQATASMQVRRSSTPTNLKPRTNSDTPGTDLGHLISLVHPPNPSGSPLRLHPKERCHGCGLWKDKVHECSHCLTRPNRRQVYDSLLKEASRESEMSGRRSSYGGAMARSMLVDTTADPWAYANAPTAY